MYRTFIFESRQGLYRSYWKQVHKDFLSALIVNKYFYYKQLQPDEIDVLSTVTILYYSSCTSPHSRNPNFKFEFDFFIVEGLGCPCIVGRDRLNVSGTKVDCVPSTVIFENLTKIRVMELRSQNPYGTHRTLRYNKRVNLKHYYNSC